MQASYDGMDSFLNEDSKTQQSIEVTNVDQSPGNGGDPLYEEIKSDPAAVGSGNGSSNMPKSGFKTRASSI